MQATAVRTQSDAGQPPSATRALLVETAAAEAGGPAALLHVGGTTVLGRLRAQLTEPPRWVTWAGGGWEGRMLLLASLFAVGGLEQELPVLALSCGVLFPAESVAGRVRAGRPAGSA